MVGESYYPLGSIEFASEINKIKAAKPDVIWSTVVGGTNVAFYKQLNAAGITGKNQALCAMAVSEEEAPGSARKIWSASCRAWAISRA